MVGRPAHSTIGITMGMFRRKHMHRDRRQPGFSLSLQLDREGSDLIF